MMEEINEFDYENRIVSNEYDANEDAEVENSLFPIPITSPISYQ